MTTPLPKAKVGSWAYSAGRIRSIELNLMGRSGLDRLFSAQSEGDIERLLQEFAYPAGTVDQSLEKETAQLFTLLEEVSPDLRYWQTLLSFREAHNLKAQLKYLSPGPAKPAYSDVASLMLTPALTDPAFLFRALSEKAWDLLDPFYAQLAKAGFEIYNTTYDLSRIDLLVDVAVQQQAQTTAEQLKDPWFQQYLALGRDLANLEIVLRSRARNAGEIYLERSLLPAGQLSRVELLRWYALPAQQLQEAIASTPYAAFSRFASSYGQPGQASLFGALADNQVAAHLQLSKTAISGALIPLSYVLSRLMEMKNVRVALSALRNAIPKERTGAMVRPPYLEWR